MQTRVMLAPAAMASLMASVVLSCSLFLGSCAGLPRGQDGVNAIQFPDMVVPDGLIIIDDAHQSHSFEAASWRQGRFVYSGLVTPAEAASYVRQRMPLHNWELVADEAPKPTEAYLRFVRGYYATEYTFSRRDGRTQLVVEYDTDYSRR